MYMPQYCHQHFAKPDAVTDLVGLVFVLPYFLAFIGPAEILYGILPVH